MVTNCSDCPYKGPYNETLKPDCSTCYKNAHIYSANEQTIFKLYEVEILVKSEFWGPTSSISNSIAKFYVSASNIEIALQKVNDYRKANGMIQENIPQEYTSVKLLDDGTRFVR